MKTRPLAWATFVLLVGAPGCGSDESSGSSATGGAGAIGGGSGGTGTGGNFGSGTGGATGVGASGGAPSGTGAAASTTGGSATAGSAAGGSATGGGATGGNATGGSTTGGNATGGSATGGSAAGGNAVGGSATGGRAAGGRAAGGRAAGGNATGGSATGGTESGGSATGGTESGGSANGGSASGGATAGGEHFEVDVQLASDVDAAAPGTIGIVTFSADVELTQAHIEFGLDTQYGMLAPVDLAKPDFRTLLLGMKPDSSYHFRIVAGDGTTSYTSDDYVIETGPPTSAVGLGDFTVKNASTRERGFIVTSYWRGNGSSVAFILDADGDIVWWYDSSMNGIARAAMSADGENMWLISPDLQGVPLQRVSMDTLDAQTYSNTKASHDMTPVSGSLMAYLDYGESDCNSIFEIDPSGTTKEVFESSDYTTAMGCHGNALRYSAKEDVYTFSDVSLDVFVVNRSGDVEWRLSEIVSGGNQAWGGTQHGHQLLDSSILVFANRGGGNQASSAVEYTLDGQEVLRFDGGNSSANVGDVQRLPGGNTLITYSNDSVVQEIDSAKNVVLEFDGGGSAFGYALWRESLYGPPPDISQ